MIDIAYNAFGEAFSDVFRASLSGALVAWVFFMGYFGVGFVQSKVKSLYVMAAWLLAAAGFGWLMSQNMGRETSHQWFLMFFYALIPTWSGCLWRIWMRWNKEKDEDV